MYYSMQYQSPIGGMLLVSDGDGIVGLWNEGQKYYGATIKGEPVASDHQPVLIAAKIWLDRYFAGEQPQISELRLTPAGSAFRQEVWKLLCEIPYGSCTTYGELARQVAVRMNKESMSGQAVGGAVGHNPISVIIPCHRVVGTDGSLTGYAGGLTKKIKLLEHEGVDMSGLFVPGKGTAL